MSKFQPGDKVVCINDEFTELDLFKSYIVKSVACDDGIDVTEYFLEGVEYSYMEPRFQLLLEWEKFQKPADDKTQLELTKIQLLMLQEWKNKALQLLECSLFKLDDCHSYELAEEINKFLEEN